MNKRHYFIVGIVLLCAILLTTNVLAMSSSNYALDWFTPLTGSGGPCSSANYTANVTVGQSVVGEASSANYETGLGYWYGTLVEWLVHLPIIMR